MNKDEFEIEALESLRVDAEPERFAVLATKEKLMRLHGKETRKSTFALRAGIAATFVVALGVGAVAGPRVLEWWEHVTVVLDEPLPGGGHRVVLEDDDGNTLMDDTLEDDEALLQIQGDGEGSAPVILKVGPDDPPEEAKPAPANANDGPEKTSH